SPDGKYLAFVRVPETAGRPDAPQLFMISMDGGEASGRPEIMNSCGASGRPDAPQLFMISMDGGEAWQFTTLPRGAGGLQWSPDGKMISFGNGATAEELAKQKETLPVPAPAPAVQPVASP